MLNYYNLKYAIKPLSHNSPVYPGLHPVPHIPVVLLQVTSPKQCPLQLYRQSDPNVPIGHSEKKILLDIDQKDDVKYIDIKISFCFLSEIKQSHVKYASLFMEGVNCLHLILVDFSLRPTFESLYNTCAH